MFLHSACDLHRHRNATQTASLPLLMDLDIGKADLTSRTARSERSVMSQSDDLCLCTGHVAAVAIT